MLAEQFLPKMYQAILTEASAAENGLSMSIATLEESLREKDQEGEAVPSELAADFDGVEYREWLSLAPSLVGVDFRPYLFIARDKQRVLFDGNTLGDLGALGQKLMQTKIQAVQTVGQIKTLTSAEVRELCSLLREQILSSGSFAKMPSGIEGFKVLAEHREEARGELVELLKCLPCEDVGPWIATGWQRSLPDVQHKNALGELLNKLQVEGKEEYRSYFKVGIAGLKK